jgi:hypothetical protein
MNRTNMILLALLLAQGACIGYQQMAGGDEVTSTSRGLLLGELAADGVTQLAIEEGDDPEARATLVRNPDGWTVAERWNHPADANKVDELLRELAALEIADVVSTTGLHAVDLGVADADFTKKVTIATAKGDKVLFLGTSGRGSSTHARLGGSDEIVAVRNFSTWRVNARPDGWVDRTAVDVPPADVAQFTLARPDGTLTFTRSEGEVEGTAAWLLSDGTRAAGLDAEAVDPLLGKAAKVSSSKVLGELGAVEDALLRVTLTTADGAVSYAVGAGEAADTYVLAVDGGGHLLQIGTWAVEKLLEADFDALSPPADGEEPAE